jgi:hypothetical protein
VLRRTHVFLFGFLFLVSAAIAADGVSHDRASLTLRGTVHTRVAVSLEVPRESAAATADTTPGFAPIARVATASNMRNGWDITIECLDETPVPMLLDGSPAPFRDGRVHLATSDPGRSGDSIVVSAPDGSTALLILEVAAR